MAREKEYQKAAHEYINSDAVKPENMYLAYGDFINGAKWADEHPINPWISVEERLPEEHSKVLIMFCNGTVTYNNYIGVGDINYMKAHSKIITHWMPIPKIDI